MAGRKRYVGSGLFAGKGGGEAADERGFVVEGVGSDRVFCRAESGFGMPVPVPELIHDR